MCPEIDWKTNNLPAEGKYTLEIVGAVEKYGKTSGELYFSVTLEMIDDDSKTKVFDTMSFSPRAMGITKRKLKALGLENASAIETDDLIGRRIIGCIKHGEDMDGEARLEIDISGQGSKAGYIPIEKAPAKAEAEAEAEAYFDDDIPFN